MYYIGVDVGGTNIASGIMDKNGNLIKKISIKTLGDRAPEEITEDIYKSIKTLIDETGIKEDEYECIGVGIPGCVDNSSGKVILTENMNLSNFEFVKELNKYIDKPIIMANDANCAVLGEMVSGAAKGFSNVLMITIGTGIGSGFVLNKKIYEGFNGAALEAGHITIKADGIDCNCGRKGCWEQYASATALIRLTKEYIDKHPNSLMAKIAKEDGKVTGKTSFDAAKKNDEAGIKVVDLFSKYLAIGITDLVNIFQPEIILVGGGISNEGEYLLDKVRSYAEKSIYAYGKIPSTVIKKAELGNDAGIIGAGFLGL